MSAQLSLVTQPPVKVQVWNMHEDGWEGRPGWEGRGEYIGRPSILGNPWVLHKDGAREVVLENYRRWLWEIMKDGLAHRLPGGDPGFQFTRDEAVTRGKIKERSADADVRAAVWAAVVELWKRLAAGETLNLICYCKPEPCHGDVLKNGLEYLLRVHASALKTLLKL